MVLQWKYALENGEDASTQQNTFIIVLESKVFRTANVQYNLMFIVSSHRNSKLIAADDDNDYHDDC